MCVAILCIDLLSPWIVASVYVINTIVTYTNLVMHVGIMRAVHRMYNTQNVSQQAVLSGKA